MARPTYAQALALAGSDPVKLLAILVSQQQPDGSEYGADDSLEAFAGEAKTVSTAAVGGTAATYAPNGQQAARTVVIAVETANVRCRYDGTNPTATVGMLLEAGGIYRVDGAANVAALRLIRDTTEVVDASVFLEYLR